MTTKKQLLQKLINGDLHKHFNKDNKTILTSNEFNAALESKSQDIRDLANLVKCINLHYSNESTDYQQVDFNTINNFKIISILISPSNSNNITSFNSVR